MIFGGRDRERPIPKRPYRDSAIFNGVLALVVIGIAVLTGGGIVRAVIVAGIFFVAATAWSWWRFRARLLERGRR